MIDYKKMYITQQDTDFVKRIHDRLKQNMPIDEYDKQCLYRLVKDMQETMDDE